MKFYTKQHPFYCGIDLHADAMYVCILDSCGEIVVHKNIPTTPKAFLRLIKPFRERLVVGCECMFSWYWLADLCCDEGIDFVLGHALYMRAIHGGKAKNDKIDSHRNAKGDRLLFHLLWPPFCPDCRFKIEHPAHLLLPNIFSKWRLSTHTLLQP